MIRVKCRWRGEINNMFEEEARWVMKALQFNHTFRRPFGRGHVIEGWGAGRFCNELAIVRKILAMNEHNYEQRGCRRANA